MTSHLPGRAALPYGAVMATGAASRLAAPSGTPALGTPLLWLALAEAVAIALLAMRRRLRSDRAARVVLPPGRRFGDFTVPLGLAVIAVGFADTASAPGRATAVAFAAWSLDS